MAVRAGDPDRLQPLAETLFADARGAAAGTCWLAALTTTASQLTAPPQAAPADPADTAAGSSYNEVAATLDELAAWVAGDDRLAWALGRTISRVNGDAAVPSASRCGGRGHHAVPGRAVGPTDAAGRTRELSVAARNASSRILAGCGCASPTRGWPESGHRGLLEGR